MNQELVQSRVRELLERLAGALDAASPPHDADELFDLDDER
ncbi:hypothetical protein ACTSKR_06225 [Chitinibacteraceae bacterium HSL-7]